MPAFFYLSWLIQTKGTPCKNPYGQSSPASLPLLLSRLVWPVNPYAGNSDKRWGYSLATATSDWSRFNGCRVGPVLSRVNEHVRPAKLDEVRRGGGSSGLHDS